MSLVINKDGAITNSPNASLNTLTGVTGFTAIAVSILMLQPMFAGTLSTQHYL
ncbi:MAG: hypothetical protein P8K06_01240 [Porticoccaceae bacterium]|nr:hypothetical protein [Porticoccaceae bacterium]MDG1782665.1 hypothetical protein [Porticoccaceae bacterium]MDG2145127.1 hypothetical protein [Porticoccaceae bacterium]|tara:strand:+ start:732 stop:890 length:159 start_codon:yes stop_codon:yes gene_type:complete